MYLQWAFYLEDSFKELVHVPFIQNNYDFLAYKGHKNIIYNEYMYVNP
jgi:hypothetical protein